MTHRFLDGRVAVVTGASIAADGGLTAPITAEPAISGMGETRP